MKSILETKHHYLQKIKRLIRRNILFLSGVGTLIIALVVILGNSSDNFDNIYTDPRDGKTYEVVAIGDLIWFKKNLNYVSPGSMCYDSLQTNCDKYGRLYSLDEARTICPEYWRLPSQKDVESLHNEMGSKRINRIASPGEWNVKKTRKFNNSLGLNILPAGRKDTFTYYSKELERWVDTVAFHQKGIAASYWLDGQETDDGLIHWHIGTPIGNRKSGMHAHHIYRNIHKFSVRCVCGKAEMK